MAGLDHLGIVGPPFSGRSSLAVELERRGLVTAFVPAAFRQALRQSSSDLARETRAKVATGRLISSDTLGKLMAEFVGGKAPVALAGFPRNADEQGSFETAARTTLPLVYLRADVGLVDHRRAVLGLPSAEHSHPGGVHRVLGALDEVLDRARDSSFVAEFDASIPTVELANQVADRLFAIHG